MQRNSWSEGDLECVRVCFLEQCIYVESETTNEGNVQKIHQTEPTKENEEVRFNDAVAFYKGQENYILGKNIKEETQWLAQDTMNSNGEKGVFELIVTAGGTNGNTEKGNEPVNMEL